MKQRWFTLFAAVLLASCAGVHIKKTEISSGLTNPPAIYIRPFAVKYATFAGNHGTKAERAIRKSLAPDEFAGILQEDLCKLAPAMVIANDERPEAGWVVEGEFDVVDAGLPGNSCIKMHVRIIEAGKCAAKASPKDSEPSRCTKEGRVIYEFDLEGGSWGSIGGLYTPGLGYATPFDYRNAAERILMELSTDAHRYGYRSSPTIRY